MTKPKARENEDESETMMREGRESDRNPALMEWQPFNQSSNQLIKQSVNLYDIEKTLKRNQMRIGSRRREGE